MGDLKYFEIGRPKSGSVEISDDSLLVTLQIREGTNQVKVLVGSDQIGDPLRCAVGLEQLRDFLEELQVDCRTIYFDGTVDQVVPQSPQGIVDAMKVA